MNPRASHSAWLLLLGVALCWGMAAGQPRDPSALSSELVTATNRFGFALLPRLEKQHRYTNVFYSPLSMTLALSMAYNGAGGGTKQAMRRALGFENLSLEQLNQAGAALLEELMQKEDAGLKLTIANSLWTRQGVSFSRDFLARNQKFYGAEISALDFDDRASAAMINDWVARSTNYKIRHIIDELEPDDALVLINAVYFKGAWTHPFNTSGTRDEVFYLPKGTQTRVPMMNKKDELRCYSGDGVEAAVLPYGFLSAQMELFLPDASVSITEFLQQFDHATYLRWKQSFYTGSMTIALPRVQLEFSTDLKPVLHELGMGIAFTSAANFSGMSAAKKLLISKVSHKATLALDEKGTEAAAVTSIGGGGVSGRLAPPPACTLIANRPFVMVITDRKSDAILFMGVVTNPQPSAN